jgi:carbon storage regulator
MLILSRKESEQICLGDNIVLTIVRIANDKVRIGVVAPPEVKVLRTELEVEVDPKKNTPIRVPILKIDRKEKGQERRAA